MTPNLIVDKWINQILCNSKFNALHQGISGIRAKSDLTKQTRNTLLKITKSEDSRNIARLLLILFAISRLSDHDISDLVTPENITNLINFFEETNSELFDIVHHGLQYTLVKEYIQHRPLYLKQLVDAIKKINQDNSNKIEFIEIIINVLHGFRFDFFIDELISHLLPWDNPKKIISFGTKNSYLLKSLMKSTTEDGNNNSSLLSISHDIGRWRENYLLGLLYGINSHCQAKLGNLLEEDLMEFSYDAVILSGNKTQTLPDYDINYYLKFRNNDDEESTNIDPNTSKFGFDINQVNAHIGNSNLKLDHILFALQKIDTSDGRVFLILRESDFVTRDTLIWYKLASNIESIFYLQHTLDGNRVLLVLSHNQSKNNPHSINYAKINCQDENDPVFKSLCNANSYLELINPLATYHTVLRPTKLQDFHYTDKLTNRVYYQFYESKLDSNDKIRVSDYFTMIRFRYNAELSQIKSTTKNSPTPFRFIRMSTLTNGQLNFDKIEYLDFSTFNALCIDVNNNELKIGDILINRKYSYHNFNCVLMTENLFNINGQAMRYLAEESIIVIRIKDGLQNQFAAKYGLEIFYLCLKLKLFSSDLFANDNNSTTNFTKSNFEKLSLFQLSEEERNDLEILAARHHKLTMDYQNFYSDLFTYQQKLIK